MINSGSTWEDVALPQRLKAINSCSTKRSAEALRHQKPNSNQNQLQIKINFKSKSNSHPTLNSNAD
jgi:hypothetical protein